MIDVLQRASSASTDETHPAAVVLARCIAQVEGASPRFEMCPGVLETRWYAEFGIPAFAYGAGRLDVSHGPDEFIDELAMRRCAAVYAFRGRATSVIGRHPRRDSAQPGRMRISEQHAAPRACVGSPFLTLRTAAAVERVAKCLASETSVRLVSGARARSGGSSRPPRERHWAHTTREWDRLPRPAAASRKHFEEDSALQRGSLSCAGSSDDREARLSSFRAAGRARCRRLRHRVGRNARVRALLERHRRLRRAGPATSRRRAGATPETPSRAFSVRAPCRQARAGVRRARPVEAVGDRGEAISVSRGEGIRVGSSTAAADDIMGVREMGVSVVCPPPQGGLPEVDQETFVQSQKEWLDDLPDARSAPIRGNGRGRGMDAQHRSPVRIAHAHGCTKPEAAAWLAANVPELSRFLDAAVAASKGRSGCHRGQGGVPRFRPDRSWLSPLYRWLRRPSAADPE